MQGNLQFDRTADNQSRRRAGESSTVKYFAPLAVLLTGVAWALSVQRHFAPLEALLGFAAIFSTGIGLLVLSGMAKRSGSALKETETLMKKVLAVFIGIGGVVLLVGSCLTYCRHRGPLAAGCYG